MLNGQASDKMHRAANNSNPNLQFQHEKIKRENHVICNQMTGNEPHANTYIKKALSGLLFLPVGD
jgi:hypothetical protein